MSDEEQKADITGRFNRDDLARMADQLDRLVAAHNQQQGASNVWRWMGGIAAAVAIGMGGSALALASQASADHERVTRHETLIEDVRHDLEDISRGVARIEGRLGQLRED